MSKQIIMTAFKECLRCVNRTPGELERAIKTFTDTVDTLIPSAPSPPSEVPPPLPERESAFDDDI